MMGQPLNEDKANENKTEIELAVKYILQEFNLYSSINSVLVIRTISQFLAII